MSQRLVLKRVLFGAILLTLVARKNAAAEVPHAMLDKLELAWTAPEECPGRARVLAEIARMARRPVDGELQASVTVVRGASGGYRAHVTMRAGSAFDERDVEGATCTEIADASALLIALALAPETRRVPSPPKPPAKAHPKNASTPYRALLHLGVGLGLDALVLPRPVSTVRPALAISSGHALLGLEGFFSPSIGQSLAGEPHKGARFRLLGGKLAGCWLFRAERLRAGPCAGIGAMGIGTAGFGVSRTRETVTWTPNVTAEARLFWSPVPRFEGLVEVVVGVPAETLDFNVDSTSETSRRVHRLPPISLGIGIGIARLWDLF